MKMSIPRLDLGLTLLLATLLALTNCAPNSTFRANKVASTGNGQGTDPDPEPPVEPPFNYEKLTWEDGTSAKEVWSIRTMEQLIDSAPLYAASVSDIKTFCPKFATATGEQRINFWAMLISAIAKYETNNNPLFRLQKAGTDPVTLLPLYGEGIMNMSYQDHLFIPQCAFNWDLDKVLLPTASTKTILDPIVNLKCAVIMLGNQINTSRKIVLDSGAYWSTLKSSSSAKKITEISAITKSLTFCQ